MPNPNEYKSVVGVDSLKIAEITDDTESAYTAGTPETLAPAANVSLEPATSAETQYADNGPFDTMVSEGETKISLTLTNVPLETLAKITGRVYDAASGRMYDNAGAVPPYFALGFRSKKNNGGYRYYWYLKGRFDMPKETADSQTDKTTAQPVTLTFTAIKTTHAFVLSGSVTDTLKRLIGDTDATGFSATGWFTQVQTPATTTPSALALSSSVPTAGATGISVSANITLTFNNALGTDEEDGVTLINATTGAVIAGANTVNTAHKVVTIDPTGSLSAGTEYRVVYNVLDIYAQRLAGVLSFTTAA
jgi:phi13 family phage major tail protein